MSELETRFVQNGWVTLEQLTLAKQEAARCGKSVWVALVKLGHLTDEDIAVFFAQVAGIAYVRISDYKINPGVLSLADESFCRDNSVIPLFKKENKLFVACGNPLDTGLINSLVKMTGSDIEPLISTTRSIAAALDYYWGVRNDSFALEKLIIQPAPLQGGTFWRESERLFLDIPVTLKVEDDLVLLNCSTPITGRTRNISSAGTAVGLYISLFLPAGTKLAMEFKPVLADSPVSEAVNIKGELVYCHMEKGRRYYLGIKFTGVSAAAMPLVNLAKKS
jgi:Type II secretion system (T2SS), protein E, N-terminal domain/PilZ domain